MIAFLIFCAGTGGGTVTACGWNGDGVRRPDLARAPDFPPLKVPLLSDKGRDHVIAEAFTEVCLAEDCRILVAYDDQKGDALAWRMANSGGEC